MFVNLRYSTCISLLAFGALFCTSNISVQLKEIYTKYHSSLQSFALSPKAPSQSSNSVCFSCFFQHFCISMLLSHLGTVLSINSISFTIYWCLL